MKFILSAFVVCVITSAIHACQPEYCSDYEYEAAKDYVDRRCAKIPDDKTAFHKCYEDAGLMYSDAVKGKEICGDACAIQDKPVAYASECCFLKSQVELTGKSIAEKQAAEEKCFEIYGKP